MSKQKEQFKVQMKFDDDTIRSMFRAEYYTYEKAQRLIRFILGALGILAALFLNMPTAGRVLLLMVGVWLLVAGDFPSKVRAEGVIEKRGGKSSWVNYQFDQSGIRIDNSGLIAYKDLDKLVFDDKYLYLFVNRQSGVMVPTDDLKPADPERLKKLVAERSGKSFRRLTTSVLDYGLKDVIQALDNRKNHKSNN